jgi:glycosyltransferase involved in cell wall biosynthesis
LVTPQFSSKVMTLKVFHIIPSLGGGGAERQLLDIVRNTSPDRFEHTVCKLGGDDFFTEEIRAAGHEVIDLGLQGKYPWLKAASRIDKLVKERRPDVINSWLYNGDIVSRLVKLRNRDIPLVTSLASPSYSPETIAAGGWSPRKVAVLRTIDLLLAKATDPFFIACSQFVASSAQQWLKIDSSRISVIYNGVDPRTHKCMPDDPKRVKSELGLPDDALVFISVGRLDQGKGYAYLIQAFAEVAAQLTNAYLVIVGAGPLKNQLTQLAADLKISERVLLPGRRRDIGACLEMADVFVFPTLFEGFGMALVEAMNKGLPCIASRLPVIEEIIDDGETGLLVAPGSATELADAMIRMVREPGLSERLGRGGLLKVQRQFLTSVLVPKWEEVYTRISNGA